MGGAGRSGDRGSDGSAAGQSRDSPRGCALECLAHGVEAHGGRNRTAPEPGPRSRKDLKNPVSDAGPVKVREGQSPTYFSSNLAGLAGYYQTSIFSPSPTPRLWPRIRTHRRVMTPVKSRSSKVWKRFANGPACTSDR